jgi:hypothetical protein
MTTIEWTVTAHDKVDTPDILNRQIGEALQLRVEALSRQDLEDFYWSKQYIYYTKSAQSDEIRDLVDDEITL